MRRMFILCAALLSGCAAIPVCDRKARHDIESVQFDLDGIFQRLGTLERNCEK